MAKPRPPNDSPEDGVEPPNHTQVPNLVFELIPDMSEKEVKVILIICRETFGWHRNEKKLSLSDLEEKTGLSRQGVISGVKAGMARGLVKRRPRGNGFVYRIKIVQNLDQHSQNNGLVQEEIPPDESLKSRPLRVQNIDSHKEERKRKKDSGGGGGARAPANAFSSAELAAPDPRIALFARYGITAAEPLARLYAKNWPEISIEQLTRLCEQLSEPEAGAHAGSRLYRKLKAGPHERQQPTERRAAAYPARRLASAPARTPEVLAQYDAELAELERAADTG